MSDKPKNSPRRKDPSSSSSSPRSDPNDADNELDIDDIVIQAEMHWNVDVTNFIRNNIRKPASKLSTSMPLQDACAAIADSIDVLFSISPRFLLTPEGKDFAVILYLVRTLLPKYSYSSRSVHKILAHIRRLTADHVVPPLNS